jgi:hypothetical protein
LDWIEPNGFDVVVNTCIFGSRELPERQAWLPPMHD